MDRMPRDPRDIPAVSPEEFAFAMAVAGAAAAGKTPQSGVGHLGINYQEEDGSVGRLGLTDIPMNRGMIAVRGQFPREKFHTLMFRIWALGEVMEDSRMAPFRRPAEGEPGVEEVHEAVYAVAAEMPLNKDGHFNRQKFFRRLAARAREMEEAESPGGAGVSGEGVESAEK
jgi:hypothetical protein